MANIEKKRKYTDKDGNTILEVENGADAKNVDITPVSGMNATTVQSAIEELKAGEGSGGSGTSIPNRIYGKTAYFFGDSLTEGTTGVGSFVPAVKTKAGLANAVNKGSSGGTSARLVNIVMGEIVRTGVSGSTPPTIDYTGIDAVLIQIGTNTLPQGMGSVSADIPDMCVNDLPNDISAQNPYLYSESGKTISSASLESQEDFFRKCFPNTNVGNIALCVEYIRWKNPACKIYLVTIPPHKGSSNQDPVAMRTALVGIGERMSVPVIDTYANSGCALYNITQWAKHETVGNVDFYVHFNATGNDMWSTCIADYLMRNF